MTFIEGELESVINGIWDDYYINDDYDRIREGEGYSVDSFFPYDWKPLKRTEIKHALDMLDWTRTTLLKTLQGLTDQQ